MGEVVAFYCPKMINQLYNTNDFINGAALNYAANVSYSYATKS